MRCDLHVHSIRSGPVNLPVLRHFGHECYSEPREVYETARRRGMDLVTLTDHDSIEGALEIAALPGTFVSEELTCDLPGGRELHLGVFGLDARQHATLQARRGDPEALFAYLAEQQLPVALNHPFSPLTGGRVNDDLELGFAHATLVETRNGMMPRRTNAYAVAAARAAGRPQVGGSDAHALASVARAWTEVPGARDLEEFLAGLRRGRTVPRGTSAGYARLTRDVSAVFARGYAHGLRHALDDAAALGRLAALALLVPLLPLLPLVTARVRLEEHLLSRRFFRRYQADGAGAARLGLVPLAEGGR
jgi:predicted metal-dependent phosphoesterase TrpH